MGKEGLTDEEIIKETEKGIEVMLRGYNEFDNELCREVLIETGHVEE